jgi:hypothetical protein
MAKHVRVIGLLVLLLVGGASLMAMPDHEVYFEYYTDGTYAEMCGEKYVTCHGIYRFGCQTQWYVAYDGDDC